MYYCFHLYCSNFIHAVHEFSVTLDTDHICSSLLLFSFYFLCFLPFILFPLPSSLHPFPSSLLPPLLLSSFLLVCFFLSTKYHTHTQVWCTEHMKVCPLLHLFKIPLAILSLLFNRQNDTWILIF